MKNVKPIIWGIAIIALGVIFGGNAIGLFNIDIFFKGWWTLFIIIPSVISLITEKDKLVSLAFIAAGVLLLLAAQEVFGYDVAWKAILAVVLILFGLSILIKTVFHNDNDEEVKKKVKEKEDDKTMDAQMAVFSGSDRTYKGEKFTGSNLMAVFGGVDTDLRNADFDKDVVIKAFALFGGIEIIVPDDVEIKTKSAFFFGGISDERKEFTKAKHTIYLDAAGGFGGISITDKSKKKH
ncbi:hypothetical protein IJG27_01055 [Candidatus Saccharibacteria bacterium]|nr:hypothetical protein [Candidatus Saccharibacteria bacterium]